MTTISKMELIDRMKKRLIEVKEEHNRLVNSLNKPKSRILKNLFEYEQLDKSPIKVEESLNELTRKLNTIIEVSNIKLITTKNVNIEDVFNLYYTQSPPFSSKPDKKYEFPDAFIIKSIETWCKTNRKKMIYLTKDNDYNDFRSIHLFFGKSLPDLLSKITIYHDSKQKRQILPLIHNTLNSNKEALLERIDEDIDKYIKLDLDFERVTNFSRNKLRFVDYKITSIRPTYAEITYFVEIEYKFTIVPTSIDMERSIFEDNIKPKRISNKIIIPCDLEMNLDRRNDIELKWINSNQKYRIDLE